MYLRLYSVMLFHRSQVRNIFGMEDKTRNQGLGLEGSIRGRLTLHTKKKGKEKLICSG